MFFSYMDPDRDMGGLNSDLEPNSEAVKPKPPEGSHNYHFS